MSLIAKKTAKFTKADQTGVLDLVKGEAIVCCPRTEADLLAADYAERVADKASVTPTEKKSAPKTEKKSAPKTEKKSKE